MSEAPAPSHRASQSPSPPAAPPASSGRRRRALTILAAMVALAVLLGLAWWLLVARHRQSTDDAYVSGDAIQITSEIAGTVKAIGADNTATVTAQQVVLQLDPADAEVAVQQAEATLASEVRAVRQLVIETQQGHSQVEASQADLQRATEDLDRRSRVSMAGALSQEDLDHARVAALQARATLEGAQARLASAQAAVQNTTVATHPRVLEAAARLRQALLDRQRTSIAAPVDGVIDRRTAQIGQRIQAGQPLMTVIPIDHLWVDANFKERELRHLHRGQRVTVQADEYGSRVTYHGQVVGIGGGTGAAFALLPAQNASGNWIKIVQRLPVRIGLLPDELRRHPLRIGLSTTVTVHLDDEEDDRMTLPAELTGQSTPLATALPMAFPPSIESRVEHIIVDNLEVPVATPPGTAAPSSSPSAATPLPAPSESSVAPRANAAP